MKPSEIGFETFYFNCKKGRHKWGYTLSRVGKIYLDESKVPKDAWHCLECGQGKYEGIAEK